MRIIMILILTFLLFGTGTLTAQENCFAHQEKWVKARAERMASRMAYEYGLTDEQERELQKANEVWLLECGDYPYHHETYRHRGRYGRKWHRHGCCSDYYDSRHYVSIRPRACFFPLFSFLPLWLHYNLNPLCVQY